MPTKIIIFLISPFFETENEIKTAEKRKERRKTNAYF